MQANCIEVIIIALCTGFLVACTPPKEQPTPLSCLISQIVTKNAVLVGQGGEAITIDGSVYLLTPSTISTYGYDSQNRVLNENIQYIPGYSYPLAYRYTSDTLFVYESTGLEVTQFLNGQGFLSDPFHLNIYQYDADGYLIKVTGNPVFKTYTIEKGNIKRLVTTYGVEHFQLVTTYNYEYDLNKPNLPTIHQYEGKQSKNLPVRMTTQQITTPVHYSYPGSVFGTPYITLLGTTTYSYVYDEAGRVKRQITKYDYKESDGATDPIKTRVTVNDYSYICH